jgi:hypothetical protein
MKAFIRENPTLAFGLGLPIVLVLVFLLVSGIPALLVAPPQYDVLYATEYYGNANGVQIAVSNGQVQVTYHGSAPGYPPPRLWRYTPKTGAVREIPIVLPPGLVTAGPNVAAPGTPPLITPIAVPDLAGLKVDTSSVAPDGYEFRADADRYSGDVFTGLFTSWRYRSEAVLTKSGRSVRLPNVGGGYYSNYARFIGWVVSP